MCLKGSLLDFGIGVCLVEIAYQTLHFDHIDLKQNIVGRSVFYHNCNENPHRSRLSPGKRVVEHEAVGC